MKLPINYENEIKSSLNNTITESKITTGKKLTGKVRDQYDIGDKIILLTTDRQSAFDRILASIPFKGQVLNQTSACGLNKQNKLYLIMLSKFPIQILHWQKSVRFFQ